MTMWMLEGTQGRLAWTTVVQGLVHHSKVFSEFGPGCISVRH